MGRKGKAMAKNICSVCCVPFSRTAGDELSNLQNKIGNLVKTGNWDGYQSEVKDKLQDFSGDLVETAVCLECGQNLSRVLERREEVVAVEEEVRRLQTEILKMLRRLEKIVGEYKREVGRMEGIVEESKEKVRRLDEFYGELEEKEELVAGRGLKEAIKCRVFLLSVVQSLIIFKGQLTLKLGSNLEVHLAMPVLPSNQLEEAEVNAGGSPEQSPEKDDGDFEATDNLKCDLDESEEEEEVAKKRGGTKTPRKTRVTRSLRPRLARKQKRISYAEADSDGYPDSPKTPTPEIKPLANSSESEESENGYDNGWEPAEESSASDLNSRSDQEEPEEDNFDEKDATGDKDCMVRKKRGRTKNENLRSLESLLPSVDWEHLPNFKCSVLQSMLHFQQKVAATKCSDFDDLDPYKTHPLTYSSTSDTLTLAGIQLIVQEQKRTIQCSHGQCKFHLNNSIRKWYDHVLGHHLKLFQCPHCPQNLNKRVLFRRHVLAHRGWTSGVTNLARAFDRSLITITQKIKAKQLSNFKAGQPPPPGSLLFSQVDPIKRYPIKYNSSTGTLTLEGVTLSVDTKAKTIKCDLCPLQFKRRRAVDSVRSVYNHVLGHHLKVIECTLCQKSFPDRKSLWTHIRLHKMQDSGVTDLPSAFYGNLITITQQAEQLSNFNKGKPLPQCSLCQNSFPDRKSLWTHMLQHRRQNSQNRGTICDICGKALTQRSHLERHKWLHKSKEEQQEAIQNGDRSYKTSWEEAKSKSNGYQCSICGKAGFITTGTLQEHERIHKAPEFKCSACGKEFRQRSGYRYHVRFVCYPGKEEGVERETLFRFQCDQCPKKFPRESKLKVHKQMKHSEEKNYLCEICGKSFTSLTQKQKHMPAHSDARPYSCKMGCGTAYKTRGNCGRHEKNCKFGQTPQK